MIQVSCYSPYVVLALSSCYQWHCIQCSIIPNCALLSLIGYSGLDMLTHCGLWAFRVTVSPFDVYGFKLQVYVYYKKVVG